MDDNVLLNYHDNEEHFRDALTYTASTTGFSGRLIEKDYHGSVILHDLSAVLPGELLFKGGTCLGKVHTGFNRLSEDLDFAIPMPVDALRSARRTKVAVLRKHLEEIVNRLPHLSVDSPFEPMWKYKHVKMRLAYQSVLTGENEFIKVEVSMREPSILPIEQNEARTILANPLNGQPAVQPVRVNTMSLIESYSEKFRAALTREHPAIRDFYDVRHAVELGGLDPTNKVVLELVEKKLTIPDTPPVDVSQTKYEELCRQLEPQLRPVLKEDDFVEFKVEQAFEIVRNLAELL